MVNQTSVGPDWFWICCLPKRSYNLHLMSPQLLDQTANLISTHGYWFIFIVMFFEGPVVTTAAAFASALGFFNVYIILFLTFTANLLADIVFYQLGYWGRENIVERFRKRFGKGESSVKKIEKLIERNFLAAIAFIKVTPGVPPFGLTLVGALRVSFKKYIKANLLVAIPYALFFVALGYYAGLANAIADKYIHHSQYWLALAVIGIFLVSYIYNYLSKVVARRIEKM